MDNMSYIVGGMAHLMGILDNGSVMGVGGNSSGENIGSSHYSSHQCSWRGTQADMAGTAQVCDRWTYNPAQPSGIQ